MNVQTEITKVLDASAAAWSKGDLDTFMTCYENSPNTAYVGVTGIVEGYNAIRAMYASRFGGAAPGAMGQLSMETLEVKPLGPSYALLTGRYHLARAGHPEATGLFTLVFHNSAQGWRILSDHSS